jgi:hypothetical protein
MANSWVTFVRKYAADNNLTYMCAATDPVCRAEYKKSKPLKAQRNAPRARTQSRKRSRRPVANSPMNPSPEYYPVINFDGTDAFYQRGLF